MPDGKYSVDVIREKCEEYCSTGEMFKIGHQYYFDLIKQGYTIPVFPEDYSHLVISYHGCRRKLQRSKEIDKFIRKSVRISDKIEELDNNFELDFYQENVLLAKIYYNASAYPENAVKIMTDQIIKPSMCLNWWREDESIK